MGSVNYGENSDLLIIGGGPAGIQASRMVKNSRPEWKVVVVRPEDHSMVYCALPYAIQGLFPLERTFKKDDLVVETGAELVRSSVRSVDISGKRVELADGRTLGYERLMIASGASPFIPPIPGIKADNVFTVKTAADARRIIERLSISADCDIALPGSDVKSDRQKAVVVGAGAIGIEQAAAYASHGLDVHLVEMSDHLLPNLLDADMADSLGELLEEQGVTVHLNKPLQALDGQGSVNCVKLAGGQSIELNPARDFVVVAVGMKPDIGFIDIDQFEHTSDGLTVDECMRTSVKDVWAAGDCVAGRSGIDGKPLSGKLATNAVPMAKVAAGDILGRQVAYPGFYNGAATVVGKVRVAGTGFTETFARSRGITVHTSTAGTTARFPMMPDSGYVKVKLVFDGDDRLVGGQVAGTEAVAERVDLLTFAIQQGATASDLAQFSYSAQPWQTFFPARNAIVEAATAGVSRGSGG